MGKFPDNAKVIVVAPASWYHGCEGTVTGTRRTKEGVDVKFTIDAIKDLPENQRVSPVWFTYGSITVNTRKRR